MLESLLRGGELADQAVLDLFANRSAAGIGRSAAARCTFVRRTRRR
jgi:hypothetical protein